MSKNIKNQKLNILLFASLFILLLLFVFINIYSSQDVSPLYFNVANENKKAVVEFLTKIKNLPGFGQFLETNKNIYGGDLSNAVYLKDNLRKQQIKELENILVKNPRARDALLRLSALYEELGDKKKAEEYLGKAKEIDPEIE